MTTTKQIGTVTMFGGQTFAVYAREGKAFAYLANRRGGFDLATIRIADIETSAWNVNGWTYKAV